MLEALGLHPTLRSDEIIVLERGGVVLAAGTLDPAGPPTEPGTPRVMWASSRSATIQERLILLRTLLDKARRSGLKRVLIGVDPMNHDEVTMLDEAGFLPTGRGPYHVLGGGLVQYVTGYQDATGSTLDLEAELGDHQPLQ